MERPGGVGGSLVEAAAGPVSAVVVFGIAWLRLAPWRCRQQAPRQVGVRRLYTYLVALVAVAVLAVGVGGLLWVLADALTSAPGTAPVDWWRDRVAQFATLTLVGLPVWVVYWRPGVPVEADEARSLCAAAVRVPGADRERPGAAVSARPMRRIGVLTLVLGAAPSASLVSNLAHDVAIAIVAGLLVAHHALTLRADARTRAATATRRSRTGRGGLARARAGCLGRLRARWSGAAKNRRLEVEVLSEAPRSPERI